MVKREAFASFATVAVALADEETSLLSLSGTSAVLSKFRSVALVGQNVTKMQLLVRDIATETAGDVITDESLKAALEALKKEVQKIQDSLKKEHTDDQAELDRLNLCFERAKEEFEADKVSNAGLSDQKELSYSEFKDCRSVNEENYENWIKKCESLDSFIGGLEWLDPCTQECVWDERDAIAGCLRNGAEWYKVQHNSWETKHSACLAAGAEYQNADAVCDGLQGTFEIATCSLRQAEWTTCNDHFMTACEECSKKFDVLVSEIECREKDRKVDHSASEKIRCYLDVLQTSPDSDALKATCKDGKSDCITGWRIEEYKKCEQVCEEVDFEFGDYQVIEGVNGTHRSHTRDLEKRCTRSLDIDFPAKQGCEKCPELPPHPCESEFVKESYKAYQGTTWVDGVPQGTKECSGFIHQEFSAYSLAECRPCPELIGIDPQNHDATCQLFGDELVITSSGRADAFINLAEVIVNGGDNNHWNKPFLSSTFAADKTSADKCIDGNSDTICHTQFATTGNFRLKSDKAMCIGDIKIINRQSGSQTSKERIVGATISVLNKGVKVWQDGFHSYAPHYAWHFSGVKEEIIHRNVCLGARDNHHAVLDVPAGTCLSGAVITHRSGYVSCRTKGTGASNFGCDDSSIALQFTQHGSSDVLMPNSHTDGFTHRSGHWYAMHGVSKNSEVLPMHLSEPVIANGALDLWYGEDRVGSTEGDNHGEACYDVKLIVCPEPVDD